jgi:hypothetical protein
MNTIWNISTLLQSLLSETDRGNPLCLGVVTGGECVGRIPDQSLSFRVSCQQDVASGPAWSLLSFAGLGGAASFTPGKLLFDCNLVDSIAWLLLWSRDP